jgi:hypothetical protein
MERLVVLLRGVNVGKHHRIAMPAFSAVLASVGCTAVQTYLQSGNAVVDWTGSPEQLGEGVAAGLERSAGLSVLVMVRTGAELAAVVDGNPFAAEDFDPKQLHAAFLTDPPDPDPACRAGPHDADARPDGGRRTGALPALRGGLPQLFAGPRTSRGGGHGPQLDHGDGAVRARCAY